MKAKPQMRLAWHKLMQEGFTPAQISFQYGEHEFVVVRTLRHHTPKIEGANYKHLPLPIPINEIGCAFYTGKQDELAKKYGVSISTLRARLSENEMPTTTNRKEQTRKVDKITDDDKTQAVNAYYHSGRKLNSTEYSPNILKQILDEQGVPEKVTSPINSKYVVRLMDALLTIETPSIVMLSTLRYLVNFTSDNPLVWKGQVLDLLIANEICGDTARAFSDAIDRVAHFMKDEYQ